MSESPEKNLLAELFPDAEDQAMIHGMLARMIPDLWQLNWQNQFQGRRWNQVTLVEFAQVAVNPGYQGYCCSFSSEV